ncbi:hypothetical protein AX17_000842 [Amanita inopinata Kibby_2008]|nr:hypothetical protein AX17_000842 [Amanita inopinata Kibby_2008]
MAHKVVLCGAGFLGKNIARTIVEGASNGAPLRVQISSRHPEKVHSLLSQFIPPSRLLPPISLDVTRPETLLPAFEDARVVISLVGLLSGTAEQFNKIQWKGAENVARAAKQVGAKLVHISAIGANPDSGIPYMRTKGLGEQAVFNWCPDATIIRPSLVFGPDDDFFNRFARLSRYLPFLPVFAGGQSRFQPVFVGDIAQAIEVIMRQAKIKDSYAGKVIEAGGPEVFTFGEIMQLVLTYSKRKRPIVSLPLAIGMLQGTIMEKLPQNVFTITRDQIRQLTVDNIVPEPLPENHISLQQLFEDASLGPLASVHEILPTYL